MRSAAPLLAVALAACAGGLEGETAWRPAPDAEGLDAIPRPDAGASRPHDAAAQADGGSHAGGGEPDAASPPDAGASLDAATPVRACGPQLDRSVMREIVGPNAPTARYRPWVPTDHHGSLVVRDLLMHRFINQKQVYVTVVSAPYSDMTRSNPAEMTFASVLLKNIELFDLTREFPDPTEGHFDLILIDGTQTNPTPIETEITLEDVYLHDSTQYSLIKGMRVSTLTLRRVASERVAAGFQLGARGGSEYIRTLIIEDSPGFVVRLANPSPAIDRVLIRRSPGVRGLEPIADRVIDDGLPCP